MVVLLAGVSTAVAPLAVHRLGVEDYRNDGDAGHFQVLGPRAVNDGDPSDDYGYPPPYASEPSSTTSTTKSGACEYTVILLHAYIMS